VRERGEEQVPRRRNEINISFCPRDDARFIDTEHGRA